ncbi:MAG: SUMF1/EgtB/PvdO family nonheme iron enzyme [Deltaproteobacteria bacterium]|nr:SUMF1/EgtB/PvdO family nonheme iron enzyme [Deltaproteobacteria bacterium]MBW2534421.1 SUMF1/EgtB/PvdO family nonheme iron enzyme [Deltaproteobacteria bacterium]
MRLPAHELRHWRAALVAATLVAAPSCGGDPERDPTGEGDMYCPATSHVGPGDAACDTGRGGPMREIPLPGGGTMCIDKTEVTVGQYQAFLAASDQPALPPSDPAAARCAEETNREPTCYAGPCQGDGCDMPQPCVSQCDAKLFCEWAGKRLCGPIGSEPLGIDRADLLDPTKNQWRNACSPDGRGWPYGEGYDSQACNTSDRQPQACGRPTIVGSFAECQAPAGPYDQVFDLSGNLFEWVDASQEADTGWPERRCIIMGGAYVHYWGDAGCGEYSALDWPCDAHHPEFGFRCCSR